MNSPNAIARAGVVAASVLLAAGAILYRQELSTWAATAGAARAGAPARSIAESTADQGTGPYREPYAAAVNGEVRTGDRTARTARHRPDTPEVAPIDPEATVDTTPHRRIMFSGSKSGPMIPEPSAPTPTPQSATSRPVTAPISDSIRRMMMSRSGPMIVPNGAARPNGPAVAPVQLSPESLARWRALLSGSRSGLWMLAKPPADSSRVMNGTKSLPRKIDSPIIWYTPRRTEDRFGNRTVDSSGRDTRTPHR